jgi:hypothetical protein
MKDEQYSVSQSYAGTFKLVYGSWWFGFGSFYVLIVFFLILKLGAPVAAYLGVPSGTAEALLTDMVVLILAPISILIWIHMRKLAKSNRARKERFLEHYEGVKLLSYVYNPEIIYRLAGSTSEDGKLIVVPVWNANGPIQDGKTMEADQMALSDFNPTAFLER